MSKFWLSCSLWWPKPRVGASGCHADPRRPCYFWDFFDPKWSKNIFFGVKKWPKNCQKWSKNGQKSDGCHQGELTTRLKGSKIDQKGPKGPKKGPKGPKGAKTAQNTAKIARKLARKAKISTLVGTIMRVVPAAAYWSKMTSKSPKLPKKAPQTPKLAQNGPKWPGGPF